MPSENTFITIIVTKCNMYYDDIFLMIKLKNESGK